MTEAVIQEPMAVLAVLLGVLAVLFGLARHPATSRIFKVVPLLVFCYFVPTTLSNTGLIPVEEHFELYDFTVTWLLPVSLVLLVMSVDVPAIMGLGFHAVVLFLAGTASIVIGGPLAMLCAGWLIPPELTEEAWKGLAALSGSWIGGGANFVAVGESVGTSQDMLALMVVVDVAVANVWMAVLLFFAGREKEMDERMGANRERIDEVRRKVEEFHATVARPTNLPDLLLMLAIAFGGTAVAWEVASHLPESDIFKEFTWVVILVTTLALGLSYTRFRKLEGAGATAVGSVLLYLLVTTIGARAHFAKIFQPENAGILAVAALWMVFHAVLLLLFRRFLKAPIFFLAVGSQANVGGAASAPIVASAFHPALAPVGVLLAVAGYVLGIYAGLACAFLLRLVAPIWGT